jgi:4a-hydroxytetrahydrobiopterin dehydratase
MTELASRKCEDCAPGTPPLEADRVEELRREVDSAWELDDRSIVREFKFKNFRDAFGLATRVALLAEEQGHHPDLEVGWGRVSIALTTHTAKGLTDNDFIMAAKIDELLQ